MTNLTLRGYDLTDDGPVRSVNEDATLVREDLGLFVLADGAGGRGKGDLAAALAIRSIENYVGATVRRTHERPDHDRLGTPEQAKRLSAAIHRAHQNLRQAQERSPEKQGLATTVVAALLSPRTGQLHIAHVGDSRCYRLRHGRLELLTEDHSVATDLLECHPEVPDDVLESLPRNAVVRALGMRDELRVSMRSVLLAPGDRFLLCSDGLSSFVPFDRLWKQLREPETASATAAELLAQSLHFGSQDNVSVIVIDCEELVLGEEIPTRPYNEVPEPPSVRLRAISRDEPGEDDEPVPSSRMQFGPEILTESLLGFVDGLAFEAAPSIPLEEPSGVEVSDGILPAVEADSLHPLTSVESWDEDGEDVEAIDVDPLDLTLDDADEEPTAIQRRP